MIIYLITNKLNGKQYVGQTTKDIEKRMQGHRAKVVSNRSSTKLHNAMRKYGVENFSVEVIDSTATTQIELDFLEDFYIKKFDSINKGYNMKPGGNINPMDSEQVAKKHGNSMRSDEVRQKISATMKKYRAEHGFSEEHRKKISEGLKLATEEGRRVPVSRPLMPHQKQALLMSKIKSVWCEDLDGNVHHFPQVYDGAYWWQENGNPRDAKSLCGVIKKSSTRGEYIKGLLWHYD